MSDILTTPVPCLINNKAHTTSKTYDVVDPHDPSKVLHKVYAASAADADAAIKAAWAAFPAWRKTPATERRRIFLKAADILRTRTNEFVELEMAETTGNINWAHTDMYLALTQLEETASVATALKGEIAPSGSHQRAYITREPFGVVLGMAPWNAPVVLGFRAVTFAIMAGNTAILKTSEFSPKTHNIIGEVFKEAGLPDGVLSILHIDPKDAPSVVEGIISNDKVRKVNFTGSTRVGQIIATVCGKYLKPVTLELGGKAPVIVLEDADLDIACDNALWGAWAHSGQVCMSTDRIIAHESIAKQFAEKLTAKLANVKASANGGPIRGIFSASAAKNYDSLMQDALDKGAKKIAGDLSVKGNLIQPLVLGDVTPDMRIYKEEIFAPGLIVLTFKSIQEAIDIANSTDYGLATSIYTRDEAKGYAIASEIEAGLVHINGPTIHDEQTMPHGGWKRSGYGRFNGLEGVREFTQTRTITINQLRNAPPV